MESPGQPLRQNTQDYDGRQAQEQRFVHEFSLEAKLHSHTPKFKCEARPSNPNSHVAVVSTVFPDDNKRYLSTDLLREEPVKSDFIFPYIKLPGYSAFKQVCHTCCDFEACTERTAAREPLATVDGIE